MASVIDKFETHKPFTPAEAWTVFKLFAFAEAIGWSILIAALLIYHYKLPGNNLSIPIAGQIHGTIFLAYFAVVFFVYPSLGWKRTITLFALLAGVVPYGTLIFEQALLKTLYKNFTHNRSESVSLLATKGEKVLVMQPSKGIVWSLPTLPVNVGESHDAAIIRLMNTFLGTSFLVKQVKKYSTNTNTCFRICGDFDFNKLDLIDAASKSPFADEFAVVSIDQMPNLIHGYDKQY